MRYLTILFISLGLSASVPAQAQTWVDVFNPFQMLDLNLEIAQADWDTIRHDTTNEIEVPALFWAVGEEDTKLLVSVRRKSSRALPSEADPIKVAYKVDINEFVGGQRWRDLTKLSLENGADTDPISEGLAWNLHEMATGTGFYPSDYHAGLAAWVRLFINGQYIGVYINVEERDSQFLRNRALPRGTTAEGVRQSWLYEIDDLGAGSFELEDGDLPHGPTWTALCYAPFTVGTKQARACPTPDDATLATDLPNVIDMSSMLTQGAVDAFSSNGDALFTHGKNFRHIDFNTNLFPERKRLYLMWDLDAAITDITANIYAKKARKGISQTEYQRVILNHPAFRTQYNAIMTGLLDGPLSEAALHGFLDGAEAVVALALAEDPYAGFGSGEAVSAHFAGLRGWVSQRIVNVKGQVQANQPPPRP
ncbi:MAG: CotH kinase family protein [Candidatus Polarisedimenticolia bacterium]